MSSVRRRPAPEVLVAPAAPAVASAPGAGPVGVTPSSTSRWRARYLLAVLFVVGVLNMMDRQVLGVLIEPIRTEFGASDTVMGLLAGYAFVIFYTATSVPLGRLSDLRPRRGIIAAGLMFWSLMTSLSGLARSTWQLGLARMGVGVGEASYYPAGLSMLSDAFPTARRPLALSIYSMSLPVGAMVALALGGWLGQTVGWRATLMWMGVPGLVMALVVHATLAEPARGGAEARGADLEVHSLRTTAGYLWSLASFRHLAVGMALAFFSNTALGTWAPTFLIRVHQMEVGGAGLSLGAATGIGGLIGVLIGGAVTQRAARGDPRWLLGVPALSHVGGAACAALFLLVPSPGVGIPLFFVHAVLGAASLGAVMTAVQGLAKVRMRALASASVSLVFNLLGAGLGPLVAGGLSDALRGSLGDASIRYALLATTAVTLWAAAYLAAGARRLPADLERAVA